MRNKKLTSAQLAFIEALMLDPQQNGARAARRAGVPDKTSRSMAYSWLHEPKFAHVQAELQRRRDELATALEITDKDVWHNLAAIAKADLRKIVSWHSDEEGRTVVTYTPSEQLHPNEAALIKSVNIFRTPHGELVQIHLHDQLEAWKTLAKMRGLMRERVDVNATLSIQAVRESLKQKLERLGNQPELPTVNVSPNWASVWGTGHLIQNDRFV